MQPSIICLTTPYEQELGLIALRSDFSPFDFEISPRGENRGFDPMGWPL